MSTPDLHTRAARFFLLAEQASRLDRWVQNLCREMSASFAAGTAAYLPAITATVRNTGNRDLLYIPARHPLPDVLSPEAVPWHDQLVAAWEDHRISNDDDVRWQNLTRLALVWQVASMENGKS